MVNWPWRKKHPEVGAESLVKEHLKNLEEFKEGRYPLDLNSSLIWLAEKGPDSLVNEILKIMSEKLTLEDTMVLLGVNDPQSPHMRATGLFIFYVYSLVKFLAQNPERSKNLDDFFAILELKYGRAIFLRKIRSITES